MVGWQIASVTRALGKADVMVTVVVVTATMVTTAVDEEEHSIVYGGGEPTVVVAAVVLSGMPPGNIGNSFNREQKTPEQF